MHTNTRRLFNHYLASVAASSGDIKNESITYTPVKQQKLFEVISERADFLKNINHVPVDAQIEQKMGLGVSRPIASRTDTDVDDRKTQDVADLKGEVYHCQQTNFDIHMKYKLMDTWRHLGNFGQVYVKQIMQQVARDILMIGFNGESAKSSTNIKQNPLLQDVNIGWLAKAILNEPDRVMGYGSDSKATEDQWKLGEGGEYTTLDMLVFDMITNLLDAWHQGSDDLIVIVGREIWVSHGLSLLSNSTLPTERNALNTWFAEQTVAGLPCVMPPFFPVRGVVVTSYSNLSLYRQMGTLRRAMIDNPKRDRIEEYMSENQAFVVEDFGKFAGVRNGALQLPDGKGGWC